MSLGKRRSKGDGAVFRRSDGRWVGQVNLGWRDGRRVRKTVQGATRKDVQDAVRALLRNVEDGIPPPTRSPRLNEFLKQWLVSVKPALRPSTYVSYEGIVRLHIAPEIGHVHMDKLSVDQVAGLIARKVSDSRFSPRSTHYVLQVLRIALNKAVRWGVVPRNVATLVDAPRVAHQDVRVLSPEETKRLLEAARSDAMEGLVVLAVSTGLRLGEALGLQWPDIDLDRRQLRVNKALQRVAGQGQVLMETKTRRSRRSIVLPVRTAEALRRQSVRQGDQRRAAGSDWHEGGFVFTSSTGRPLDQRNVLRTFGRILRTARLPKMRFHDLRHSCASLLLAEGVSPRVVMEMLGHSRISVTMDTYTHVMPALMTDAADAIDRSLAVDNAHER